MKKSYSYAAFGAVLVTTLGLLAACVQPQAQPVACPEIGVLPQAEFATFFADNAPDKTDKNIAIRANFANYKGECYLKRDHIEFSLELFFRAERGKAGGKLDEYTLPYFMAVLTPQEDILQRDAFNTSVLFTDYNYGTSRESHVVVLPVNFTDANGKRIESAEARQKVVADTIASRKIVLGFALTPEQRDYNLSLEKGIDHEEAAVEPVAKGKP